MIALVLLAGCTTQTGCDPEPVSDAAFAAVLSDFNVGALALGGVDGRVGPPVLATSGDAIVRVVDGRIYVAERGTVDALTALDPAAPEVPLWQVALPRGANVHDVVAFDGRLWLPCFGTAEVLVVNPVDGAVESRVELASLAEDGNPDLDRAAVVSDRLFVAAQQLYDDPAIEGPILSSDGGALVELDATGAVVDVFDTPPNPRIRALETGILVATGLFVFPGAPADRDRDGSVSRFDVASGTFDPPLLEEDGSDVFDIVVTDSAIVALTVDGDARSEARCIDRTTGTTARWSDAPGWYNTAAVLPSGDVVLGIRTPPEGGEPASLRFDPDRCAPVAPAACASLDPYDFARL